MANGPFTWGNGGPKNLQAPTAGAVQSDSSGNYTSVAPSTSGNVLTSDGSAWISSAAVGTGAITALTGDATASGPGSSALTLATVNSNVGSFGSTTAIPNITVNGKGLITAASTSAVVAPAGTLTGATLAANVLASSLTSVGTITSGTWTGTTIALANGGTGQTTKAPAFDALQPMTTGGDLIYGGASGTGTRLANGSNGQVLTSSGTTVAPTWTSAPNPLLSIVSKTTTYAASSTDDLILCSGSAFTVTLYTAVGATGKVIRIKKTDSSLTNAITIDGNSTETIDGALTVQCSTQYEEWTLASDGANWQVLAHSYPSDFVAYTPTFTGAGTVTNVKMYSRRVGDSLHVRGTWQCGTVTASTAAISLGYGGTDGNITTAGTGKIGSTLGLVGNAAFNGTGVAVEHVIAINGATVVNISNTSATSTGLVAAAGNSCWSNSQVESVDFMLPVAGWNG